VTFHAPLRNRRALLIGFSLIEMLAALAVAILLAAVGIRLLPSTRTHARRTATDQLVAMVEQARTTSIAKRAIILVALAEPDLPSAPCQIGLLQVQDEWPDPSIVPSPLHCTLLGAWKSLETGIIFLSGAGDGVENPLDRPLISIDCAGRSPMLVHPIAFHPQGGLLYPPGSGPLAIRIAEGSYRAGKATPDHRAAQTAITENRIKIGRVTARAYLIEP
jgi:hypothetical protein